MAIDPLSHDSAAPLQAPRPLAIGQRRPPRVALYSHDTYGLGHLRRCLKISAALARTLPRPQGLILTGSPWSGLFRPPPGFRYAQLPAVVKTGQHEYCARDPGRTFNEVLALRRDRLQRDLAQFDPDLLVVDNVPCGLAGELLTSLHAHRERGGRLALSLRDVLDDDSAIRLEWRAAGADLAVTDLYDEIWIFGSATAPAIGALPPSARAKAVFCGYLGNGHAGAPVARNTACSRDTAADASRSRPRVLVTGGGGADATALVSAYLLALQTYRPGGTHRIVLGPDFPDACMPAAADLSSLGVELVRFETDMHAAIAAADVVVAMAGYNTVCEALAAGRRLVLVPRQWPRREQSLRAQLLARCGRAEVVPSDLLTPESLWRAVERSLAQPEPFPLEMEGAVRMAERAADLLSLDPATASGRNRVRA